MIYNIGPNVNEDKTLTEAELPYLWILTPLASTPLLNSFGAALQEPTWPAGVYWLPGAYRTAFVVIHKLPVTPETLWLRILGRGTVQRQAIQELLAFPADNPLRNYVLELLSKWQLWVERQEHLTQDEQEELMNTGLIKNGVKKLFCKVSLRVSRKVSMMAAWKRNGRQ